MCSHRAYNVRSSHGVGRLDGSGLVGTLLILLTARCRLHSRCWSSDRLTLPRIGRGGGSVRALQLRTLFRSQQSVRSSNWLLSQPQIRCIRGRRSYWPAFRACRACTAAAPTLEKAISAICSRATERLSCTLASRRRWRQSRRLDCAQSLGTMGTFSTGSRRGCGRGRCLMRPRPRRRPPHAIASLLRRSRPSMTARGICTTAWRSIRRDRQGAQVRCWSSGRFGTTTSMHRSSCEGCRTSGSLEVRTPR